MMNELQLTLIEPVGAHIGMDTALYLFTAEADNCHLQPSCAMSHEIAQLEVECTGVEPYIGDPSLGSVIAGSLGSIVPLTGRPLGAVVILVLGRPVVITGTVIVTRPLGAALRWILVLISVRRLLRVSGSRS